MTKGAFKSSLIINNQFRDYVTFPPNYNNKLNLKAHNT